MDSRFVVVPAAYVFFLRPDPEHPGSRQVLLQLREGTGYMDGYWAAATAGHVEKGESVFEAAVREAREELGVELDTGDLTPLCAMHRTGNGEPVDERVDYFFAVTTWVGDPMIMEAAKCADLRWFALDELPDLVVPHELVVLEAVWAGDVPPILTHGFK